MRHDVMTIEAATTQTMAAVALSDIDTIGAGDRTRGEMAAEVVSHETEALDAVELPVTLFADALLQALAAMAMRSKRRQADLCAALCRANLDTDPRRVTDALRQLERSGCIEHLVPLYDGGVLMSVTSRGIEKLNSGPRWNMLDGAGFLRG